MGARLLARYVAQHCLLSASVDNTLVLECSRCGCFEVTRIRALELGLFFPIGHTLYKAVDR